MISGKVCDSTINRRKNVSVSEERVWEKSTQKYLENHKVEQRNTRYLLWWIQLLCIEKVLYKNIKKIDEN